MPSICLVRLSSEWDIKNDFNCQFKSFTFVFIVIKCFFEIGLVSFALSLFSILNRCEVISKLFCTWYLNNKYNFTVFFVYKPDSVQNWCDSLSKNQLHIHSVAQNTCKFLKLFRRLIKNNQSAIQSIIKQKKLPHMIWQFFLLISYNPIKVLPFIFSVTDLFYVSVCFNKSLITFHIWRNLTIDVPYNMLV